MEQRKLYEAFSALEWQYVTSTTLEWGKVLHSGEFLLLLYQMKPCVLFAYNAAPDSPEAGFIPNLIEKVVRPVMPDLTPHGYELYHIEHAMKTSNPVHPGFQGAWVLANTKHANYGVVRQAFMTPTDQRVPEQLIGKALGYPTHYGNLNVMYVDETRSAQRNTMIAVTDYTSENKPDCHESIKSHFAKCRQIFASLGHSLSLHVEPF
ncbi:hypothetical protein HK101_001662 [Irineochytrium annulatum]|nr:hypothetical protein HK101_001662 [Irineochytrium annulatum]